MRFVDILIYQNVVLATSHQRRWTRVKAFEVYKERRLPGDETTLAGLDLMAQMTLDEFVANSPDLKELNLFVVWRAQGK